MTGTRDLVTSHICGKGICHGPFLQYGATLDDGTVLVTTGGEQGGLGA